METPAAVAPSSNSANPTGRLSERWFLLLLALVQFTHIMDFMIMMPLGPQLMRVLSLTPGQFGSLISSYTLTSGLIGLLVSPFIDRFGRKRLLLWTYAGFGLGTLACALSHDAGSLLLARAVCGMFGGISNVLVMVITADVVPPERRATAMGIIMTAFSAAAAFGVPFGLQLAQWFTWETPFFLLAAISAGVWMLLALLLPPMRGHLAGNGADVMRSFVELLRSSNVGWALLFMVAMVGGHFVMIPFLSPHLVLNMGLPERDLSLVYFVGGIATVFSAPTIGRLADRHGRKEVFTVVVLVACVVVLAIANSGPLPVVGVLTLTLLLFVFASGRFVPGQAIVSLAVPARQRGTFMSLSACSRDVVSGVSATLGGLIVGGAGGSLTGFRWLGWVAVGMSLVSLWLVRKVESAETKPESNAEAAPIEPASVPAD
ncbi:MAG TPA: MFS transporter [Chthoniobacterales bacterium]